MKNAPRNEMTDDPIDTQEKVVAGVEKRLFDRIESLGDGSPVDRCLIQTLKEIVERYIFVSAYVAVNRADPDWSDLLVDLVEEEDVWSPETDSDVLALFEARRALEEEYRKIRLENKPA